jgi:hypothetical protein
MEHDVPNLPITAHQTANQKKYSIFEFANIYGVTQAKQNSQTQ